jgi:tRNA (mo5U34)-methyltransferase
VRAAYEDARAAVDGVERWYHRIELMPGLVTPGEHDSPYVLERLPFPPDCAGMSVLDIGARDGFFSFEAERRGAQDVLALDIFPSEQTGFHVARRLLDSHVEFVSGNVYDLSPETHGQFDLILALGLLYHLRNPMLALDRIRSVCRGRLVIETEVEVGAGHDLPLARFHPGESLKGDGTNYWTPNLSCLRAMLEAAAFEVRSLELISPTRAAALALAIDEPRTRYFQRLDYTSDVRLLR